MLHRLPLLVFLCVSFASLGQQKTKIHVIGGPTVVYRLFTGSADLRSVSRDIHGPKIRYDAGVLVRIAEHDLWNFETGFVFSRKALSFGELKYYDQNNEFTGSVSLSLITDYLEIPFRALRYTNDERKDYFITGLSGDFLINSKFDAKETGNTGFRNEKPTDLRKLNFSLHLGYGLEVTQSENIRVHVEPNFKIQLLNVYDVSGSMKFHYYQAGIAFKVGL